MSEWDKIYYRHEKKVEEELELSSGIIYSERPGLFKKAPKKVIIIFKDEKKENNKKRKKRK